MYINMYYVVVYIYNIYNTVLYILYIYNYIIHIYYLRLFECIQRTLLTFGYVWAKTHRLGFACKPSD
jgi:hypothetical protein